MELNRFRHEFKQLNGVRLTKDVILLRRPLEVWSYATGETLARGRKLDDVLSVDVGGMTVADLIGKLKQIEFVYNGGRGSGSGLDTFSFGHASSSGSGHDTRDLPARINVKMSGATRSYDEALRAFWVEHTLDAWESAVTVDEAGFVTQYVHGGATSVGISGRAGEVVIHNHPSGGNFSDSDLLNASLTAARGVVAVGDKGAYSFTKGTKFDANAFIKAVKNARMTGKDYNSAADRWLKRNQKRFGYSYSFTPIPADLYVDIPF